MQNQRKMRSLVSDHVVYYVFEIASSFPYAFPFDLGRSFSKGLRWMQDLVDQINSPVLW